MTSGIATSAIATSAIAPSRGCRALWLCLGQTVADAAVAGQMPQWQAECSSGRPNAAVAGQNSSGRPMQQLQADGSSARHQTHLHHKQPSDEGINPKLIGRCCGVLNLREHCHSRSEAS